MISAEQLSSMVDTVVSTFDREARVLPLTNGPDDDYGNADKSYIASGELILCGLVHQDGREVTQDRNTQITDWIGRFPPQTALSGRDRLAISAPTPAVGWLEADPPTWALYEVVGPPERLGTHVRANLLHIDGG